MTYSTFRPARLAACCALAVAAVSGCGKTAPPVAEIPLPTDEQLRERLDRAIEYTYANRHLNTKDQAAWQVVHGALVFGRDFQIYNDGKLVKAIDYLLAGGQLRGWNMRPGDHGLEAILEAGSNMGQGHEDQWMGYLSQCGITMDDSLVVGGQTYKIRDLVTQAQWDIYDSMEATWTLMAFSTYLPLDTEWTAKDGTKWTIERMVGMEAGQDLETSACGGTHRMYALAIALNRYLAGGGKVDADGDGAWDKCQRKIDDAVTTIRENQQPDGSFSTNYFSRPGTSPEISKRISATGHALEFLMVVLDDDELREPWVERAVVNLVDSFEKTQKFDLECGALYHATRALDLYRMRRFGPRAPLVPSESLQPAVTEATANKSQ